MTTRSSTRAALVVAYVALGAYVIVRCAVALIADRRLQDGYGIEWRAVQLCLELLLPRCYRFAAGSVYKGEEEALGWRAPLVRCAIKEEAHGWLKGARIANEPGAG